MFIVYLKTMFLSHYSFLYLLPCFYQKLVSCKANPWLVIIFLSWPVFIDLLHSVCFLDTKVIEIFKKLCSHEVKFFLIISIVEVRHLKWVVHFSNEQNFLVTLIPGIIFSFHEYILLIIWSVFCVGCTILLTSMFERYI